MKTLLLCSLGPALSSRSLARTLADTITDANEKVTVDFSGIKACNQSFINELLLVLMMEKKIPASSIQAQGFDPSAKHIQDRFEKEFLFFKNAKKA